MQSFRWNSYASVRQKNKKKPEQLGMSYQQ